MMVGDVVLYAGYVSTNGNLIYGNPAVVVSHPSGQALDRIEIVPSATILSVGDRIAPEIWGVYTNGLRNLLYIGVGEPAVFSSLNQGIVGMDTNGVITANALGSATVTASYRGLSAQAVIAVLP